VTGLPHDRARAIMVATQKRLMRRRAADSKTLLPDEAYLFEADRQRWEAAERRRGAELRALDRPWEAWTHRELGLALRKETAGLAQRQERCDRLGITSASTLRGSAALEIKRRRALKKAAWEEETITP